MKPKNALPIQLTPVTAVAEPAYPERLGPRSRLGWKQAVAVLGAAAALWLPACGDDVTNPLRMSGDVAPVQPRTAGVPQPTQPQPTDPGATNTTPPQPPPPTLPDNTKVRLGGEAPPTQPGE